MSERAVGRNKGQRIALVLLDEHPLTRIGVRNVLESEGDIAVVAEAETLEQAVRHCRRHRPDVVLIDLDLPPAEMVDAIRRLREECGDRSVVVLSHQSSDAELYQAAVAGAAGHVDEAVDPAELATTIRRVARGEEPIGQQIARRPTVSRRLLEAFRQMSAGGGSAHEDVGVPTERQLEILRLAAAGLTNQEIGRRVGISTSTVKAEFSSLLRSLGLRHRTQAVVHAVSRGWIGMPEPPPPA